MKENYVHDEANWKKYEARLCLIAGHCFYLDYSVRQNYLWGC